MLAPASHSFRDSLRRRIDLGYLGYFLLAGLLAALSVIEGWQWLRLEKAVQAGNHVDRYLELVLEARRYEKNWMLYGKPADWSEIGRYARSAEKEFALSRAALTHIESSGRLEAAERALQAYLQQASTPPESVRPELLRASGQALSEFAEAAARGERRQLSLVLHQGHVMLFAGLAVGAIGVTGIGIFLRRRVVRPLRELERCAEAVARGEAPPAYPGRVWEIGSISQGFRALLDELEARRRGQLRAEKLASLGTLVSGVAHEINNPLNNIGTSCQLLLEDDGDPASREELLRRIESETARAAGIVGDLRAYAREAGETQLDSVPLAELTAKAVDLVRMRATNGVIFETDIPELAVRGDRGRLLQVLVNLLENALDAAGDNGLLHIEAHRVTSDPPCLGMRVLTPACPPPWLCLSVTDNGPGVPPEQLPHLFDPFFTSKDDGMGLGLFLVQSLVAAHAGGLCVGGGKEGGLRVEVLLAEAIPS